MFSLTWLGRREALPSLCLCAMWTNDYMFLIYLLVTIEWLSFGTDGLECSVFRTIYLCSNGKGL